MDDQAIKVLFFGVFSEDSTNISQAKAFERNGCIIKRHDFRKESRLPNDIGWDLIFYSKCNELGIDAVEKYKGIKCLWYMDPINGNYNDSLKAKFPLVDFICFALHEPWMNSQHYATPTYLIEEGFDPDVDKPCLGKNYEYGVSFIGNLYNQSRKDYHKKVKFDVVKCSRLEHPVKVAQSQVNLNFTDGGTSDRAYKIMASYGFLLSEYWEGCPFINKKEIVLFDGAEDLKVKAEYYRINHTERIIIASNGFNAVQKYSRTNWAKRILDIYKQCKS